MRRGWHDKVERIKFGAMATPRGGKKREESGAKKDWDDSDPKEEAKKKSAMSIVLRQTGRQ